MSTKRADLGEIGVSDPARLDKKGDESVTQNAVFDNDPEQPVAPDQFDDNYRTSKWEIWAYYTCVARGSAEDED